MSSTRWLLALAFAAAVVTVATLAVATAEAEGGAERTLVLVAAGGFAAFAAAAGGLVFGIRRPRPVSLGERAQTASKLSHELKNPLMAIKGLASTGARLYDQLEDQERREFFGLIDEEAGRLRRVIEQSATALKLDADALVYDFRAEDLGALVEKAAWAAPHGDHPMAVQTDPAITVLADRRYLSEAIESLVDNASKFSPPDAPIDVSVRRNGGAAVIEIADRGPGIPAERVEAVFERFGSWRPAGYEETPGAGLGLFVTRAHVQAHDGRVVVSDRQDGGTILRITLPVEDEGGGRWPSTSPSRS